MEEQPKNQNKKKIIIEKYNASSQFYDKRYRKIQEEKYEIVLRNYRANGKLILDLGCGTGLFFSFLAESLFNYEKIKYTYIALDISWNMLLRFKSKINNTKKNSVDLILSDIEYLPFRENKFCSIFSLTSFQNLPHIPKGIEESLRVGKNNADYKFSILKKK